MTDDLFSPALAELAENGLLRRATAFDGGDGRTVTLDGKRYLLFCSNDYLRLSHDPRIIEAVKEGLDRYGFGSGGSRLISGTRAPHAQLEKAIAEFLRAEAALLFSSGYSANTGCIPALAGKGDAILADKLNHASLVDGCLLSKADFHRYPHRNMAALEKLLQKTAGAKTRWIVTDGLFSMDGDLAPLDALCGLAKKHHARVYVDDAHAFGVLGANGRGTAELFGVGESVDITVGTLGKAAGGMGAFAAGKKSAVDFLLNKARSFIFSTAMPPADAAGNLKAVEILADFHEGRKRFLEGIENFHTRLKVQNLETSSKTYIIPLVIGEAGATVSTAKLFWDGGVFLQAVRPPAVPEGTSRLRLTLSLAQTDEDRETLLAVMKKALPAGAEEENGPSKRKR
ncbi:MAG: 8-amino-7-oxononanoate synthase [Nitrospinae bacterium]|nr:8-amino-7-oxononanoate synthase [Nitrospinota bacterium]